MNIPVAIVVILGALIVAAAIIAYPWLRRFWRTPEPLSTADIRSLSGQLPWYGLLDARQRDKLARLSARLLAEVRFVGCNGVEMTSDMRLLIAAQASLLCLGAQPAVFTLPGEILIYPDAFYIPRDMPDEHGLVDDLPMLASGEAWPQSRVVLSWPDVADGLAGAPHNVVVHEFAHLLDFAAPGAEGAPPLANYDSWSAAFSKAYEQLRTVGSPVIDVYGAESPTEFFAVTVEAFFQRGAALADAHADVYTVIAAYFDIDTANQPPSFKSAEMR